MTIEPGRLLVVDDNETRRTSLARQLEELGHTVAFAPDGDRALDLVGKNTTDLVLLALGSTRVNAYQVLRKLRERTAGARVPVIVVSSADSIEGVARCLELGADDYMLEPLHPALLKTRVDDNLDRQRTHDKIEQDQRGQQVAEEALRTREKYERDVHIGRQIQASFLPTTMPQIPGWEVAARFQPAREVAGDWYDAFHLQQINRIGVVIGDVCDKGVGAALFMGLMRSLIRAFAQSPTSLRWLDAIDRESPVDPTASVAERRRSVPTAGSSALRSAMEQTNNYIAKNHGDTGMFATVFFGLFDPTNGQLLYINGGHEKPVIIGADGIRQRLDPTGLGVGMMPDSEYSIGNAQLQPGEYFVLYTDGVPESRDSDRKFFTEARLLRLMNDPPPTAAGLLDRIVDSVQAHIADADQYDDVTLLAVKRSSAPRS